MTKKLILLIFLFLCLSGCAIVSEEIINLSYTPQPEVSIIPDAGNVIISVKVINNTGGKGFYKNLVGYKGNAKGLFVNDVETIIRQAMEKELRSRGFTINNEAFFLIFAELTYLWNDFNSGDAVAGLRMTISIKSKKGDTLFSRILIGEGVQPNILLTSGKNAELALNKALENGMKLLFNEQSFISALLEISKKIPAN
jgi:uncharacterized lipoprotein